MYIHEYQAKELLAEFGVVVPRGTVAHTPEEAENATGAAERGPWMVKAQIHAGGRGKGGGAKLCKTPAEVRAYLDGRSKEEQAALRKVPAIASAIDAIRAESAKAAGIDGEALLADF